METEQESPQSPDDTQAYDGDDMNAEFVDPTATGGSIVYMDQSEFNRLTMQRNHAATRIGHIINNIAAFQDDIMALETRRDMLKTCYQNYDQSQSLLEQLIPDEMQNRDAVDTQYITGLSMIDRTINSKRNHNSSGSNRDAVRLPSVDLPVFSGLGEAWLEWFDKFNGLIHQRSTLATIQKFEYLKLSLRGPALGLIDSLPTTEANYAVAYDMLIQRYNNPKLLIQRHTRELFEIKSVEVESAASLRNLFDTARKHLRCLQILNQPVEAWDAFLIHLMANKLDPITRREWEAASSGTIPPSYSQLETFVTDRCQMLDALPTKRKQPTETTTFPKKFKTETRTLTVNRFQQGCAACRGDHALSYCNRYKEKALEDKLKMVKRFSLCYNCLKPNHTADQCHGRGCLKCDGRHHTSIHREKRARPGYPNSDSSKVRDGKSE